MLNAAVYGWSLPSIRDTYRSMLLGGGFLDAARDGAAERDRQRRDSGSCNASPVDSAYSYSPPPTVDEALAIALSGRSAEALGPPPPHVTRLAELSSVR